MYMCVLIRKRTNARTSLALLLRPHAKNGFHFFSIVDTGHNMAGGASLVFFNFDSFAYLDFVL